jgi:hypothetical protein
MVEIYKEGADRKEPKPEISREDQFLMQWRHSKYYTFVMKIIDNEINTPYLKEQMAMMYSGGQTPNNEEVGIAAKVEYQTEARLNNVKEALR